MLSFITRKNEARRLWNRYRRGPIEISERLWVHTFFGLLPTRGGILNPFGKCINRLNQSMIGPQLRKVTSKLGFKQPVIVIGSAFALPLLDYIPHRLLVYHCSDDYSAIPSFPAVFKDLESDLMSRCDAVIATAEELKKAKSHLSKNIFTVTNGANVEHFAKAGTSQTVVAEDLLNFKRPLVGYVGSVFEWIDQTWIIYAANRLPEWSFVFIGPIHTDISRLKILPNVHFLGPRPYEELPRYLKGFDIATVPFVMDKLTLCVSPVKFYEYLASGVPIVATRLPDLEPLSDYAYLVNDRDGFTSALQHAIAEDSPEKRKKRTEIAKNHSWEMRYSQVDAIINKSFGNKKTKRTGDA
ncbi:MAG: glycosyltransferase [Nitrospirota bacterium]